MGTSVQASASLRPSAEKKLRKRKELDAMVAKARKNKGPSCKASSSATQELLGAEHVINLDKDYDDDDLLDTESSDLSFAMGRGGVASTVYEGKAAAVLRPLCSCKGLCWMVFAITSCFLVIVVLLSLHVHMKMQLNTFRSQLEQVVADRNDLKLKYHDLHSQLQDVISNQTQMKKNMSRSHTEIVSLSSQFSTFNSSLTGIQSSLKAAPVLENLPSEVDEVKNDVAKFGSRLTEMETRLKGVEDGEAAISADMKTKSEKPRSLADSLDVSSVANLVNNTVQLRLDLDALDSRVTNVGTSIAGQLEEEEKRSQRSLELIASLQNNVQNITVRVTTLQDQQQTFEEQLQGINTKVKMISKDNAGNTKSDGG